VAIMYAGGPTTKNWYPVANGENIGPNEAIYYSSNQYVGQGVNNCYPCAVSSNNPITATADGSVKVLGYDNPNTEFWADVANGTLLATDVGCYCDLYSYAGIDVDSSGTNACRILKADTTNQRALIKIAFNLAYEQTGLS
jgi:hypothetical protein